MSAVKSSAVRKKPCPYCGKRLQAISKGRWRNNLARHLSNCQIFQTEWMKMTLRVVEDFLKGFGQLQDSLHSVGDYVKAAQSKSEIEALERLYSK